MTNNVNRTSLNNLAVRHQFAHPAFLKNAIAIVGGHSRIKPIKRTRKRQIAKAKHMMAWHDHTSYEWSQWWHSKARKPKRWKR